MSKIEQFRKLNGIKPGALARASGLSLKAVELVRKGNNTTLESAKALALAFSKLLRREVAVGEIFDLSIRWTPPQLPDRKVTYDRAA